MEIPRKGADTCLETLELIRPDEKTEESDFSTHMFLDSVSNEDCVRVSYKNINHYSLTYGAFWAHRSSKDSLEYQYVGYLPQDKESPQFLDIHSKAGASDYWSLALVGFALGKPYAAYRMNRSCQLRCPTDNFSINQIGLIADGSDFGVTMKSDGCTFYVDYIYPV
jgi:hypothetical protein